METPRLPFSDADEFLERQFADIDLTRGNLSGKTFEGCTFNACDFSELKLLQCKFVECEFKLCNLSLVNVQSSRFRSVALQECKALGIDWTRADWPRFPGLAQLKFHKCILNDSSFFGLALEECVFDYCKARDVDFREANLTDARCSFTDFAGALFGKTNLSGADFSDAIDYEIDIFNNLIKGAKFSRSEAVRLLTSLQIVLVD
jgi:uncharacterized protein YjbI with pentapeptide repeats